MLNRPLSSGSPLHFTKNQIASNRDKCQSLYINSIIHYDFSRNPLCVIQVQEMMAENLSRMNSTTNKDWWDVILWDEIVSTYMGICDFVLAHGLTACSHYCYSQKCCPWFFPTTKIRQQFMFICSKRLKRLNELPGSQCDALLQVPFARHSIDPLGNPSGSSWPSLQENSIISLNLYTLDEFPSWLRVELDMFTLDILPHSTAKRHQYNA